MDDCPLVIFDNKMFMLTLEPKIKGDMNRRGGEVFEKLICVDVCGDGGGINRGCGGVVISYVKILW